MHELIVETVHGSSVKEKVPADLQGIRMTCLVSCQTVGQTVHQATWGLLRQAGVWEGVDVAVP